MVFALSAALLLSSAAPSPGEDAQADVMQRLLAKSERAGGRKQLTPHAARVERRAQLSEYEREVMTKQIMQAISGTAEVGRYQAPIIRVYAHS